MLTVQGLSTTGSASVTTTISTTTSPEATTPPSSTTTPTSPAPPSDQVLLVWTPGGLPEGFADWLGSLPDVAAVTTVRSDLAHLGETFDSSGELVDSPPAGFVIPIEVMGFDPVTYSSFISKKDLSGFGNLAPDEIILSSTSAQLRRLAVGGVLVFENDVRFNVAAVVDDVLVGGAEVALPQTAASGLGITVERYVLIRHSSTRKDLEAVIRNGLPEGVAVRIRAPGETPILRHGDAVLPPAQIKLQFGEFSFRPGSDLTFDIEPAWVNENIVTESVPILGAVTCHRNLIPPLAGAMAELEERNLGFLVIPEGFRGCFNPRYIASRKGISRHAWGAAVDINMGDNPEGVESAQDPRLIEVMERWGFTSGHQWLIPDAGHFEYVSSFG